MSTAAAAAAAVVLLAGLPFDDVSGLAVGERGLYVHEDSGNGPRFARVDRAGKVLHRYALDVEDVDWEDMAAAPDAQGTPSLWFADVGDNRGQRDDVLLHRVAEAAPEGPVTTYRFTYEDGPRDAEALLVLPGGRQVAVVSKAVGGTGIYTAALDAGAVAGSAADSSVLRRAAVLPLQPTGTPGGPVGSFGQLLVTGGAVSADGRRLALRTYTDLYEWAWDGDLTPTFARAPVRTALPDTEQGEALGYEADGGSLLVASEGDDAPLHRITPASRPGATGSGVAAGPGSSSPEDGRPSPGSDGRAGREDGGGDSSDSSDSGDSGDSSGAAGGRQPLPRAVLVGAAAGGVAAVGLLALVLAVVRRRRR